MSTKNNTPISLDAFRKFTDKEATTVAQHVSTTHRPLNIQEIVDYIAEAVTSNQFPLKEFMHEFNQDGRTVRRLTTKMIEQLAIAQGISEVSADYTESEELYQFTVVVEFPHPISGNMIRRAGFAEEPKTLNGHYDKFARQKAYTEAFCNACTTLLPLDIMVQATAKLAKLVPTD